MFTLTVTINTFFPSNSGRLNPIKKVTVAKRFCADRAEALDWLDAFKVHNPHLARCESLKAVLTYTEEL